MDLSSPTADSSFQIADHSLSALAREDWFQTQLFQSKWFSKLKILIFGLTLALAVDLLFNFPLGLANPYGWTISDMTNIYGMSNIMLIYILLLTLIAVILLTFTSMCLTLRFKKLDLPSWVQEFLWICLIVILVVGFLLFDWYMFSAPNAIIFGLIQL